MITHLHQHCTCTHRPGAACPPTCRVHGDHWFAYKEGYLLPAAIRTGGPVINNQLPGGKPWPGPIAYAIYRDAAMLRMAVRS